MSQSGYNLDTKKSLNLTAEENGYRNGMIAIVSFSTLSNISCVIMFLSIIAQKSRNTVYSRLVLNLCISDFFQSVGFMFSYYWIKVGRINIGTVCDIQGMLINLGDVSSGFWTLVICIHTYMIVIHSYEYPHIVLVSVISVWLINITISASGLYIRNSSTPFFASAGGSWCWISDQYKAYRVIFHYGLILIIATLMVIMYTIMFIVLYNRQRKTDQRVYRKALQSVNKKLVWYPFVYFTLVFPLALQRIYTLNGHRLSDGYLILAACLFSSTGFVNAIIYGITRHLVSIPRLRHRKNQEGIFSNEFRDSRLTSRTSTQIINSNRKNEEGPPCIFITTTQQIQISHIKSKLSDDEFSDKEMNTDTNEIIERF
ncbi:hypothetical protein Glove_21g60 [Diversispora epigaea]|uniref:G-protein coupled receptors family 1 profile domain-containing protein n=1 Tax=Diversispora epigaea TaxID=1348612 RepID=A0A397JMS8_9GLOM|nr:hypothetical protein Glove_21g60 [Diversispora epigaea]